MSKGYVYVLVNSAMPGLVKVGKTTKRPSERALELSGVTGIPTPFIVAFEQLFEDCDEAEDYIHAELERKGFREAQNREFFRAQTSDVVRIVMQTPGHSSSTEDNNDESDSDLFSEDDPNEDLALPPSHPWDDLLEEAENYYYGHGDTIEDIDEAILLYKQAARLGSLLAYEQLGWIYYYEDRYEDTKLSLKFLKEGAKRGNYYCYQTMATIFSHNNQIDNMKKCIVNLFQKRRIKIVDEVENDRFGSKRFVDFCADLMLVFPPSMLSEDFLIGFVKDMQEVSKSLRNKFVSLYKKMDIDKQEQNSAQRQKYERALLWFSENNIFNMTMSDLIKEYKQTEAPPVLENSNYMGVAKPPALLLQRPDDVGKRKWWQIF